MSHLLVLAVLTALPAVLPLAENGSAACESAASGRPLAVPCTAAVAGLATNFTESAWAKAGSTGDFVMTCVADGKGENGEDLSQKPRCRTTVRFWHDRINLYARFDCWAADMADGRPSERRSIGREHSPRGDIVEFYVAPSAAEPYYMMMMDRGHDDPSLDVLFDAKVMDSSWNSNWERHVKRMDDRWVTILRIPFDSVGVRTDRGGKILFQAIRQKYFDSGRVNPLNKKPILQREMSSWTGGYVHQVQNFGELTLELK